MQRRAFFKLLPLALAVAVWSQSMATKRSPVSTSLAQMRDRYRPLLIAAGPDGEAKVAEQVAALQQHGPELLDRQIVLLPFSTHAGLSSDPAVAALPAEEQAALRRRFHLDDHAFTVVLVGKDGSEKFRAHTPITIEQLIALIDAMPMRKQEMSARPASLSHSQAGAAIR